MARLTNNRGNREIFSSRIAETVQHGREVYGDVYVYKPNAVCISHPGDILAVLGSQDFQKTDFFDIFKDANGTRNLSSLRQPELASRRRRQLGPYFTDGYLGKAEPLILRHGYKALRTKWDGLIAQPNGGQLQTRHSLGHV